MPLRDGFQKPRHKHETGDDHHKEEYEEPAQGRACRKQRKLPTLRDARHKREYADGCYVFAD